MRATCPAYISTFHLSTHEYFVRRNNHKTPQYKNLPSFVLFIHLRSKYYPEHPLSLFYPFKIRAEMYFVRCILIFNFLDSRLTHKTFKPQGNKLVPNVNEILWRNFCYRHSKLFELCQIFKGFICTANWLCFLLIRQQHVRVSISLSISF
jgi:hypothetical protein